MKMRLEATIGNATFRQLITACALVKTDESGWFTPKDICAPYSKIIGDHRSVETYSERLKDFSTDKRGNILFKRGNERNYRFRFAEPAMQPYALMKGIESGFIDETAMSISFVSGTRRPFCHLAPAPFFAIALRSFGVSFLALAFPPLRPPLRCPSAFSGTVSSISPETPHPQYARQAGWRLWVSWACLPCPQYGAYARRAQIKAAMG